MMGKARTGMVWVLVAACLGFGAATAEERTGSEAELRYDGSLLVQLTVSDVKSSIAFYRDVVGFELESYNEELDWARIVPPGSGIVIGLGAGGEAKGSGSTSLNFGVRDLPRARLTLESRGVTFTGPTITIPGVVRLATFQDPDGNRIRLADHPPEDAASSD